MHEECWRPNNLSGIPLAIIAKTTVGTRIIATDLEDGEDICCTNNNAKEPSKEEQLKQIEAFEAQNRKVDKNNIKECKS